MTKRSLAAAAVLALAMGLLTATPALATYSVSSIRFPNGATTFFSPFSGPATITVNFDDDGPVYDPPATLSLRLRLEGSSTSIHTQTVDIDPNPDVSPKVVQFNWPALNVSSNTRYEVAVYKGSTQLRERAFTLRPRLVKITSIAPDPFFPYIADGYKDTTDVTYQLLANSNPIDIQIFEDDGGGGCCGNLVRQRVLFVNRVAGTYHFIWNGRDDGGALLPVGRYWVVITATAYTGIPGSSIPVDVSIERFFRTTRTVTKNGIAFHHRSPITVLRSGGTCALAKDTATADLRIRCRNARVRVFWRWNLPASGEITQVGFDLIPVPGYTCGASKGHIGNDSFLQVGAVGQRRCRVDKARITYSYLRES